MVDQLILGDITFQNYDYAPPNRMPFGGEQAMIVHKLPGGSRVIDTLGPDEADIGWEGFFLSPNAMFWCQRLDAMRGAGQVVTLTYAGMSRQVVVKTFRAHIRRYPNWVEYQICCTVYINPTLGPTAATQPVAATTSAGGGGLGTGVGIGAIGASAGGAAGGAGGGAGGAGGAAGGAGSVSLAGLSTADQLILTDLASALRAAEAGAAIP